MSSSCRRPLRCGEAWFLRLRQELYRQAPRISVRLTHLPLKGRSAMSSYDWALAIAGGATFGAVWFLTVVVTSDGWIWGGVVGGIAFTITWLLVALIRTRLKKSQQSPRDG